MALSDEVDEAQRRLDTYPLFEVTPVRPEDQSLFDRTLDTCLYDGVYVRPMGLPK